MFIFMGESLAHAAFNLADDAVPTQDKLIIYMQGIPYPCPQPDAVPKMKCGKFLTQEIPHP
jgi:hypothetical protein